MGFAGRLEGIAPSDIFQIISQSRMTGTLIARCPDGTAMVVFKKGQVIEAASDAQHESLGHLLVSQGTVSEEQIETARERRKLEPDRPLGAILVEMKAISKRNLDAVVLRQIEHIVLRLASCEDGFITFDRGETALKRKLNTREFFLPAGISTEYLMMERARTLDEERERRKGTDRRTSAAVLAFRSQPVGEPGTNGRGILKKLESWFRSTPVPGLIRKGVDRARSAARGIRDVASPWLRSALDKARAFSPDGRSMVKAGIGTVLAGVVLITLAYRSSGSELVITGRVVNLRAKPTIAAKVVAKVVRGDVLAHLSTSKGWHQVRTNTGDDAWLWHKLGEQRTGNSFARSLGLVCSVFVLAAGLSLLVVGILRRRRTA
jgi:hypothetical protein